MGGREATYRNSTRMAVKAPVEQMYEEGVGFIDLWDTLLGKKIYA